MMKMLAESYHFKNVGLLLLLSVSAARQLSGGDRIAWKLAEQDQLALNKALTKGNINEVFSIIDQVGDDGLTDPWIKMRGSELHAFAVYHYMKRLSPTLPANIENNVRQACTAAMLLELLGSFADCSVKETKMSDVTPTATDIFKAKIAQYVFDVGVTKTGRTIANTIKAKDYLYSLHNALEFIRVAREQSVVASGILSTSSVPAQVDGIEDGETGVSGFKDLYSSVPPSFWDAGLDWAHWLTSGVTWEEPTAEQRSWFLEYDVEQATSRNDADEAVRLRNVIRRKRLRELVAFAERHWNKYCELLAEQTPHQPNPDDMPDILQYRHILDQK